MRAPQRRQQKLTSLVYWKNRFIQRYYVVHRISRKARELEAMHLGIMLKDGGKTLHQRRPPPRARVPGSMHSLYCRGCALDTTAGPCATAASERQQARSRRCSVNRAHQMWSSATILHFTLASEHIVLQGRWENKL